jgi:uncharacterized delta-60 repeat protein
MKGHRIYLAGLISLIFISFNSCHIGICINEQDNKSNKNGFSIVTASDSVVYAWNRTWGGQDYDSAQGLVVDSAKDIYIAGFTHSFGAGGRDMNLVKYNQNGKKQWNQTWGGSSGDDCYSASLDSGDNIYITGHTWNFGAELEDIALIKYDGNGIQQWNHTWGGNHSDYSYGLELDSKGNIYLAGKSNSFGAGGYDAVLVKFDNNGTQLWNRTWGGNSNDGAYGVAVDSIGGIFLTGETYSFGAGGSDIILIKYNEDGEQQWNSTWGGNSDDYGLGIAVDSIGTIYLAGETYSFGVGGSDMVLVKLDNDGTQLWNRTWGGNSIDRGNAVSIDSLGSIYLTGYTWNLGAGNYDFIVVKYNNSSIQQWNHTWGGYSTDLGFGAVVDYSGNIFLAGETHSFGAGSADMVLVKFIETDNLERPPPDILIIIIIIIIVISIAGISIVMFYFAKKTKKS